MPPFEVQNGGPVLAVADFEASMRFYTEGLGFSVEARFDDPSFAILGHGPVRVCLAAQGHPSEDLPDVTLTAPSEPTRPSVRLVLWVADVHAVHAELVARGVPMASEPWSPPWGGGRFFARDPDGFLVEFETLA
ncbi:MAG: VOC family protein [Chloroflexota bacterium]